MKKLAFAAGALIAAMSLGTAEEKKEAVKEASSDAAEITRSPSPKGAKCYIIWPKDGATVGTEFSVRFGLKGMGVAPAGVDIPNTGHHHLLVDAEEFDVSAPIPMNDNYRHFGGGQTEAVLELEPGEHTLMLVLGDKLHIPHDPPVASKKITVKVVEGAGKKGKKEKSKER